MLNYDYISTREQVAVHICWKPQISPIRFNTNFFVLLLDTTFFEFIFGMEMKALLWNRRNRNCLSIGQNPALKAKLELECEISEP